MRQWEWMTKKTRLFLGLFVLGDSGRRTGHGDTEILAGEAGKETLFFGRRVNSKFASLVIIV